MAHSNVLIVAVVALLAACATCVPDTAAAVAVQEAGSVDSSLSVGARDLLRRRRKSRKTTKKKRVKKSESVAENTNLEGVLVNQQTNALIEGDGNGVVGGGTSPIFNAVVDTGDIFVDRKLKSVGGGARDLLRRRKKKSKKTTKKNIKRARSEAVNVNDEGVLVNQQTNALIEGDFNGVVGGETSPIFNANVDIEDIIFDRRKLLGAPGGARDLLRRRKKRTTKKTKRVKKAESIAINDNDEGVLINQQTTANIDGDGNLVVGGETSPIFNANVDVEDIFFDRKLLSAPGGGARDLLRKRRKRTKKTTKKNIKRSRSAAQNVNNEGVLVNQQTNALIEGDGNVVEGGFADEITNINVDIGDINPPIP